MVRLSAMVADIQKVLTEHGDIEVQVCVPMRKEGHSAVILDLAPTAPLLERNSLSDPLARVIAVDLVTTPWERMAE
jgi:hypothetical protein